MNLQDYQRATRETAIYPDAYALEYLALGLCSEAGEVAGKIKKFIRDTKLDETELRKEIGDTFWYLVRLCDELRADPEEILEQNMNKLLDRKQRGVLQGSGDNR